MKSKRFLLSNALESWRIAVKYCKDIHNGLATLHYQKTFISSLHNAIELLLKQIMMTLNNDQRKIFHTIQFSALINMKNRLLCEYFDDINEAQERKMCELKEYSTFVKLNNGQYPKVTLFRKKSNIAKRVSISYKAGD